LRPKAIVDRAAPAVVLAQALPGPEAAGAEPRPARFGMRVPATGVRPHHMGVRHRRMRLQVRLRTDLVVRLGEAVVTPVGATRRCQANGKRLPHCFIPEQAAQALPLAQR
jgi:hypothetical protein